MYSYLEGIVKEIEIGYITLDINGIGYMIYVSDPYYFKENEKYKVYVYQKVAEDENTLYGFKNKEEKDLFLKLISVKGLGPKMALPMLTSNTSDVLDAINTGNINYLKKFPKIGDKVARQIILDLKGKLSEDKSVKDVELIETLKALGYKKGDIDRVVKEIDPKLNIEIKVKEALKLLLK